MSLSDRAVDRCHCVDRFIREIHPWDVKLNQSLLRQESVEQKLQHLHVLGVRQVDGLADEFCLFVGKECLRDCRRAIFGPARATRIALCKGSASRKFRVLSRQIFFSIHDSPPWNSYADVDRRRPWALASSSGRAGIPAEKRSRLVGWGAPQLALRCSVAALPPHSVFGASPQYG